MFSHISRPILTVMSVVLLAQVLVLAQMLVLAQVLVLAGTSRRSEASTPLFVGVPDGFSVVAVGEPVCSPYFPSSAGVSGHSLSEAMDAFESQYPDLYVTRTYSGEDGGSLRYAHLSAGPSARLPSVLLIGASQRGAAELLSHVRQLLLDAGEGPAHQVLSSRDVYVVHECPVGVPVSGEGLQLPAVVREFATGLGPDAVLVYDDVGNRILYPSAVGENGPDVTSGYRQVVSTMCRMTGASPERAFDYYMGLIEQKRSGPDLSVCLAPQIETVADWFYEGCPESTSDFGSFTTVMGIDGRPKDGVIRCSESYRSMLYFCLEAPQVQSRVQLAMTGG